MIPATAGPLALAYPKWVQGEHAPTGPIMQVQAARTSKKPIEVARQGDLLKTFRVSCPDLLTAILAAKSRSGSIP